MKHRLILFFSMALLLSATMQAAGKYLHPAPQQMSATGDSISIPTDYRMYVFEEGADEPALKLLYSFLPYSAEKAGFGIYVGARGDKSVKKFSRNIPQKAEGYYLKIDDNNIVVAGADRRGLFYGVQTLLQLAENGKLPAVEITDYPDVPYRGVVEGFYGKPWSHMARLRQLEFYGRNKMNVYIYGPKDDPYHRTPDWRIPYPEEEAERMRELVQAATDNNVIFYWAIHPGQDIKWNDEDRDNLLRKFEHMYQLGVRGFAVFFDDISGEGTKADKQAELLNYIDDNFIQTKHDVAPLIMCPTEYNKSWTKLEGGYLATLGERLNGDIHIMWTGDKVVETIDMETLDFVNPLIKRKAFIWWNFPVSDYVQPHLLMGEVYGNGLDIKDDVSAFVSNPMEYAEASKIAIQSIADYTWNMEAYDSRESWLQAIRDLMPENAEYLKTFVSHNSDLGPNGHNFQRMESEEIAPALDTTQPITESRVVYSTQTDTVMLYPADDMMTLLPREGGAALTEQVFNLPDHLTAPLKQGDVVGTVTLTIEGESIGTVDLIAGSDVDRNQMLYTISRVGEFFSSTYFKVVIMLTMAVVAVYAFVWVLSILGVWSRESEDK